MGQLPPHWAKLPDTCNLKEGVDEAHGLRGSVVASCPRTGHHGGEKKLLSSWLRKQGRGAVPGRKVGRGQTWTPNHTAVTPPRHTQKCVPPTPPSSSPPTKQGNKRRLHSLHPACQHEDRLCSLGMSTPACSLETLLCPGGTGLAVDSENTWEPVCRKTAQGMWDTGGGGEAERCPVSGG